MKIQINFLIIHEFTLAITRAKCQRFHHNNNQNCVYAELIHI